MITVIVLAETLTRETRTRTFVFQGSKTYGEVLTYFEDHLWDDYVGQYPTVEAVKAWKTHVEPTQTMLRAKPSLGMHEALETLCGAYEGFIAEIFGEVRALTVNMDAFNLERLGDTIWRIDT